MDRDVGAMPSGCPDVAGCRLFVCGSYVRACRHSLPVLTEKREGVGAARGPGREDCTPNLRALRPVPSPLVSVTRPNKIVRIGRKFGGLASERPRRATGAADVARFRPTGLGGTSCASDTATGSATAARSRPRASRQSQRHPACTHPTLPSLGARATVITRAPKRDRAPRPV